MFALLNVVKTLVMSLILILGAYITTTVDFRFFFMGMGICWITFQLFFLHTFDFEHGKLTKEIKYSEVGPESEM